MGVRNLSVLITGDGTDLRQALIRSAGEVERFTKTVEREGAKQGKAFALPADAVKKGTAGLALALATGAVAVGTAAAVFEANLRNLNTISGQSEAQLARTGDAVLNLSRTVPQSANDIAKGLYDIASSGFQGADGLLVVEASAKAASAGLSTTAEAAKAIDAVLNAYGLSAASATSVSDVLFQTVNLGVLSFQDLTSVIGDTVGSAAAARIPIEQLGAAIAAVTLSGISPSEAGTSVNNLITALIKPSEDLAKLYQRLGYESGEAALQSRGLSGVLEDIRQATGGNVTALLGLFPEIRAARGAFALMANDGANYAKALDGIADPLDRAGATQRAFDEQMKATSAQFRLFVNGLQADAVKTGTVLLPPFTAIIHELEQLRAAAGPEIAAGFAAITPTLQSLYRSGVNVVEVLGALLNAAEPAAAALGQIGGGALLASLTGIARVLEVVTGFMADHPHLVLALAAAYGVTLLPTLAAVEAAFARMVLTPILTFLDQVYFGAGTAAAGMRGLAASLLSVEAVATAGFAAAIFLATSTITGMSSAAEQEAGSPWRSTSTASTRTTSTT